VLVVEDDAAVRDLSCAVLRQGGYTVLEAGDGREARELAQRHPGPLHLLVTDLIMPGMSGQVLADLLVRTYPGLKVLFVSGYVPGESAPAVRATGTGFLAKPFTPDALLARVRLVLDRPAGEAAGR
jgi:CheY-like chemotaxis protein